MRRAAALAAVLLALTAIAIGMALSDGDDGEATVDADPRGPSALSVSATGWATDFGRHSVPLDEFASGGPPRDGIPPIDEPRFVPVEKARGGSDEPVIGVEIGGEARAYPIRILIWHEIVNDTLAGRPIVVTFCPLCNTSIVFDRRLSGRELTFGTTGNLRFSDLVMWDRQTESWWQQFTGEAIVGEQTGARLDRIPSRIMSLGDFRERYPEGEALSQETGHDRPYGQNPYVGYDDVDSPPFLLVDREPDDRLAPKERVVSIEEGRELVAVPFGELADRRVVDATVGGRPVTVWWSPGVNSPLDAGSVPAGRDVWAAAAFDRRLDGRVLTFTSTPRGLRDVQTGSGWSDFGEAFSGPLAGRHLRAVAHDTPFWFAVAAFRPDTRIVPPL